MRVRRRAAAGAVLLLTLMLVAGACSATDDDSGGGDAAREVPEAEAGSARSESHAGLEPQSAGDSGGGSGSGDGFEVASSAAPVPRVGQAIVKDAALVVEVIPNGLRDAVDDAIALAADHGGFVLSTSIEDARRGLADLRLRVPSESFEEALAGLERLGDVKREEISGRDVTEEFVDLEARLRHLEAQERVLLGLMDDATTVVGSIRVQRQLTPVQLDIERIRGRMRFLEDRTSLGTIALTLREKGIVAAEQGPLGKALSDARAAFVSVLAGAIVVGGFLLPAALLAALIAFLVRLVWRRAAPTEG